MDHHHRSSSLKQANKPHKQSSGHSSKRAIIKASHGRVERVGGGSSAISAGAKGRLARPKLGLSDTSTGSGASRLNQAKQRAEARRQEAAAQRRLAGGYGPPKIVAIVGLSSHANTASVAAQLIAFADDAGETITSPESIGNVLNMSSWGMGNPIACVFDAFRQRILLTSPPRPGEEDKQSSVNQSSTSVSSSTIPVTKFDVASTLSGIYACDVLIVIADMSQGTEKCIDEEGDLFISALRASGVPTVLGVIAGLDAAPLSKRVELKRYATRLLTTEFGTDSDFKIIDQGADPFRAMFEVERGQTKDSQPLSLANYSDAILKDGSTLSLVRTLCALTPKQVVWRANRPYIPALHLDWVPSGEDQGEARSIPLNEGDATGTVRLSGFLRGRPLNVNQLICLPGGGVFQITSVSLSEANPFATMGRTKMIAPVTSSSSDHDIKVLSTTHSLVSALGPLGQKVRRVWPQRRSLSMPPSSINENVNDVHIIEPNLRLREPLESVAEVDRTGGEQTWPVEGDDMEENEDDDYGNDDGGDYDDDDEDANLAAVGGRVLDDFAATHGLDPSAPDYESIKAAAIEEKRQLAEEEREKLKSRRRKGSSRRGSVAVLESQQVQLDDGLFDDAMTMADDRTVTPAEIIAKRAAAKHASIADDDLEAVEQEEFPDEVDTPLDIPARVRFQRYRGLKSFRTSPWDPKEALPPSYARIFAIPHFKRTQRRILNEAALTERTVLTLESRAMLAARDEKKKTAQKIRNKQQSERGSSRIASSNVSVGTAGFDMEDEDAYGEDSAEMSLDVDAINGGLKRPIDSDLSTAARTEKSLAVTDLSSVLGEGWVSPGQFVTLSISGVTRSQLFDAVPGGTLVTAWGLLRHENRASVVHYDISRTSDYPHPLKSREQLEFHVGPRCFDVRPLFSEYGKGGGPDNTSKCRFHRYFLPGAGRSCLATAYAPITFAPYPVLVFKRIPIGDDVSRDSILNLETVYPAPDRVSLKSEAALSTKRVLVAVGSVVCADPDRIVLKRTILSGFPVKVSRSFAMVQYMFFNPEDVNYFKPVELYTKSGLVGHITMSVGTHGRMKAHFDRPIQQNDTVCLPLYKRIYPKWGDSYKSLLKDTQDATNFPAMGEGGDENL